MRWPSALERALDCARAVSACGCGAAARAGAGRGRGGAGAGRDGNLVVESAALLLERGAGQLRVRFGFEVAAVVLIEGIELELKHQRLLHLLRHRETHFAQRLAMAHAVGAAIGVVRVIYTDGACGGAGFGSAEDQREQSEGRRKRHQAPTAASFMMKAVSSGGRKDLRSGARTQSDSAEGIVVLGICRDLL